MAFLIKVFFRVCFDSLFIFTCFWNTEAVNILLLGIVVAQEGYCLSIFFANTTWSFSFLIIIIAVFINHSLANRAKLHEFVSLNGGKNFDRVHYLSILCNVVFLLLLKMLFPFHANRRHKILKIDNVPTVVSKVHSSIILISGDFEVKPKLIFRS